MIPRQCNTIVRIRIKGDLVLHMHASHGARIFFLSFFFFKNVTVYRYHRALGVFIFLLHDMETEKISTFYALLLPVLDLCMSLRCLPVQSFVTSLNHSMRQLRPSILLDCGAFGIRATGANCKVQCCLWSSSPTINAARLLPFRKHAYVKLWSRRHSPYC